MVSAVFHSPREAAPTEERNAMHSIATPAIGMVATGTISLRNDVVPGTRTATPQRDFSALWLRVLPPLLGLALEFALVKLATAFTFEEVKN